MTRDEVLAMPAGRALDALVAERLMGFTNVQRAELPASNQIDYEADWPPPLKVRWSIPEYSTEIAAAWTVVGRLKNRFSVIEIVWVDTWCVTLDPEGVLKICFIARGDTAPLAICRAALLTTRPAEPA